MSALQSTDSFISRKDLCARLGVHHDTVRRLERSGKLTGYHLTGKCARYREADVDRLLREASQRTTAKPGPKPRQLISNGAA